MEPLILNNFIMRIKQKKNKKKKHLGLEIAALSNGVVLISRSLNSGILLHYPVL